MTGEVYAGPKKKTTVLLFTLVWGKQDGVGEGNGRKGVKRMRIAKGRRAPSDMAKEAENKKNGRS